MSDLLFYQQTNRLKEEVIRLQNAICAYQLTDASKYPENFDKLGLEMAMRAEAIACSTRNIAGMFLINGRSQMIRKVSDAQGIRVERHKLGYEIVMPYLMAKRNGKHNVRFLLEPLSYALRQYTEEHTIERLQHAVIWFIYEYAEDTPRRYIRDYDNMEAKEVLDLINTYFLVDDSGRFCELRYSSRQGERNQTRVIISQEIGLFSCPQKEKN